MLKKAGLSLAVLAVTFFPMSTLRAQEAPDQDEVSLAADEADGDSATITLETMIIRKTLREEELKSTSATVLENEDITDRIYVTPLDMLTQSPGVSISQFSEGGIPALVRIRGFDGSHLPDIAFFLDGVPMNDGDKYADTNTIMPLEIGSLDIVKGPASVLYGNFASGGAISYHTFTQGDFNKLRVTYGSYNTVDVSGIIAKTIGKWDQVYAFQGYHTDGFRDNSDWDKYNLSAKWTYHASDDLYFRFGLRGHSSEWNSAGYIPYDWDRKKAVDDGSGQANGGDKTRVEARAEMNYDLNSNSNLNLFVWGVKQEYNRYYLFQPRRAGDERGTHMDQDTHSYGVKGAYNYFGELFGREVLFSAGINYSHEKEDRVWWNLKNGARAETTCLMRLAI